jgi:aspartyl-tRNA(Asn)/glutamyl-tRNA(Gln) amidotransferase subunit A
VSLNGLNHLTISQFATKLAKREVTSRETMQACLDQIRRVDGQIKAFISYDESDALTQAAAADQLAASAASNNLPLLGVPVGIKDVIAVKGQPLNCGSRILDNYVSPYDATVISKLKAAGGRLRPPEHGRIRHGQFDRKLSFPIDT